LGAQETSGDSYLIQSFSNCCNKVSLCQKSLLMRKLVWIEN
jgi:hypothetical protein